MRTCFLMLSLASVLASCGNQDNKLLRPKTVISALEQRSFISIPHETNHSVIRSKLLNAIVEESLPSENFEAANLVNLRMN